MATLRLRWLALDRRRLIAIAAALVAASIAGQTVHRARAQTTALGTRVDVVVATRDIEAGSVIQHADLDVRSWPRAVMPSTPTFSAPTPLVGRSVRATIHEGEPLTDSRLVAGTGDIELTERAVTIPQPLAPPPLDRGDIVELVGVRAGPVDAGSGTALFGPTTVVLGVCRVLAVSDSGITTACSTAVALDVIGHVATGSVEVLRTS